MYFWFNSCHHWIKSIWGLKSIQITISFPWKKTWLSWIFFFYTRCAQTSSYVWIYWRGKKPPSLNSCSVHHRSSDPCRVCIHLLGLTALEGSRIKGQWPQGSWGAVLACQSDMSRVMVPGRDEPVFSASYSCFPPHVQASLALEGERAWPQMNCFTTSCLWCTSAAIKQYAKTHIYLYLGLSHSESWLTESGLLHNRRSVVLGTAWLSPWPRPKTEPCFSDIWSRLLFHYALNACATVLCYWIRAESVKCELKCHASGHFMFPELRAKKCNMGCPDLQFA